MFVSYDGASYLELYHRALLFLLYFVYGYTPLKHSASGMAINSQSRPASRRTADCSHLVVLLPTGGPPPYRQHGEISANGCVYLVLSLACGDDLSDRCGISLYLSVTFYTVLVLAFIVLVL